MHKPFRKLAGAAVAAYFALGSGSAQAALVAVWGDNTGLETLLNANGHTVTFVTDAQVATPGFLNGFDVFTNSRCNFCFDTPLSAAASAQVQAYATGNMVLLNGDWFDTIGLLPTNDQLILNVMGFAASLGHGYVGEFAGAVQALDSNVDGLFPLGLINGSATTSARNCCADDGNVTLTAAGLGHVITAGLAGDFPYNPFELEFSATIIGVDSTLVLARYDSGNPAIIAATGSAVPEPSTLALLSLSLLGAALVRRRTRV